VFWGGSPKASGGGGGVENVNFSWQEIVRFGAFWQPALFLAGNRMTTVAFEREIFLKA